MAYIKGYKWYRMCYLSLITNIEADFKTVAFIAELPFVEEWTLHGLPGVVERTSWEHFSMKYTSYTTSR
jgi:hypothetical protein